ncbi:DUF4367 domain-containing protein [Paenibacillus sp. UMB4589-SE434]|uniref:DUF4367 domain-containing protein n=1 Tax=Paenibacillus sp. UMB4589-SE434 TaxID=3046314 RepID=UPI0025502573|nr:DUF4367 domain-containing protein [Paenibacillus sp. UMB4589-SE434]MDK8182205.1 DUF4367 domain-containing protein [Paenibacillus sp. UMB4589-SE434]
MRRITWVLAIVMSVTLLLAGCGQKDASAVVKELDQKMSKLQSYEGIGTMTLHSGQQPLQYKVEVKYQDPTYYRIELTNPKKDIKQIVLRNDEGVFVLTPSLKKSFRFQSDWPDNQGQVYLYQTLIHSILADNTRQFATEGESYVFEVAANYQTDSLVKQKIWLNKGDYKPKQVQVTDAEARVVVEMQFDQFNFDKKFDKEAFDMQANMTASANIDPLPVITDAAKEGAQQPVAAGEGTKDGDKPVAAGEGTKDGEKPVAVGEGTKDGDKPVAAGEGTKDGDKPVAAGEGTKDGDKPVAAGEGTKDGDKSVAVEPKKETGSGPEGEPNLAMGPFGIITPSYAPDGVAIKESLEVPNSDNHAVLIRYSGTYTYTLMESRPKDVEVGVIWGHGIDLGFTLGQLTGDEQKSLTWMFEGVKYRLTSSDLPQNEMVKVAQSLVDQPGK